MRKDRLVCFAHGKESGPWGTKITQLAKIAVNKGYEVTSPDYRDLADPDARVERLLGLKPSAERLVLVGSSMGGYVSTVASEHLNPTGLFLMAPAFYLNGYADQDPLPEAGRTFVVHGWRDDVVPFEHSISFAALHHVHLYLLDGGHALEDVLPQIETAFASFLDGLD